MENRIIEMYDSIIRELFIVMGATIIYLLLCQQWIFAIFFSIMVLGSYKITKNKTKEIKNTISGINKSSSEN
jgi:TM2 domain-containing membrane protein YozV